MRRSLPILLGLAGLTALPAFAQDYPRQRPLRMAQESSVQSSITLLVPLTEGREAGAAQEEALTSFYLLASRQCALVLEALADSCEVVSVSTNLSERNRRPPAPGMPEATEMLTLTGQIAMRVTFRPPAEKMPE